MAPLGEVLLGGIAYGRVSGEAGRDVDRAPRSEDRPHPVWLFSPLARKRRRPDRLGPRRSNDRSGVVGAYPGHS